MESAPLAATGAASPLGDKEMAADVPPVVEHPRTAGAVSEREGALTCTFECLLAACGESELTCVRVAGGEARTREPDEAVEPEESLLRRVRQTATEMSKNVRSRLSTVLLRCLQLSPSANFLVYHVNDNGQSQLSLGATSHLAPLVGLIPDEHLRSGRRPWPHAYA